MDFVLVVKQALIIIDLVAEEEGLLYGAYHFGTGEDGKDQAEHFLETIGDSSNILLALDIEENKSGENITPKQAKDFVNRVYLITGRLPLIYGGPSFLKDFATTTLTECPLWLAKWGAEPILPKGLGFFLFKKVIFRITLREQSLMKNHVQ